MPRTLTADDFSPTVMQRAIPGQAGCQFFFNEGGRAFCLYAVIGSYAQRATLVAKVNAVLATVQIDPTATGAPTGTTPDDDHASPSPSTTTTTTGRVVERPRAAVDDRRHERARGPVRDRRAR